MKEVRDRVTLSRLVLIPRNTGPNHSNCLLACTSKKENKIILSLSSKGVPIKTWFSQLNRLHRICIACICLGLPFVCLSCPHRGTQKTWARCNFHKPVSKPGSEELVFLEQNGGICRVWFRHKIINLFPLNFLLAFLFLWHLWLYKQGYRLGWYFKIQCYPSF